MGSKTRYISTSIVGFIIVAAGLGLACALQRNTLVEWWKPAAICFVPSCAIGFVLSRVVRAASGIDKSYINIAAGILLAFSILMGGFYSLNYYKSKPDTTTVCEAVVAKKYTEDRYRTKRISRNRTTRGEKYKAYCVDIQLPGGWMKHFELSAGEYTRIHKGQKFALHVEDGFFGIPVIREMRLPIGKSAK